MSKAMDALDRVAQYSAGWKHSLVIGEELALLRDYITTTEAERAASVPLVEDCASCINRGVPSHGEPCESCIKEPSEKYPNYKLDPDLERAFAAQRQLAHDESAARIKELEEALRGLKRGDCFCECGINNPMMGGKHSDACLQAQAALSGARKVEPEGLKGER